MLPFFIARRYLFSKKSHNAINILSLIAVLGVAVATMAMVCVMSVFNGFENLVAGLFTDFDPELMVSPARGTTVAWDDRRIQSLKEYAILTPVMEGQALVVQDGRQVVVKLRGVGDNFMQQCNMSGILYGDGSPMLHVDVLEYGIVGVQLAQRLGVGTSFENPLQIYAPKRGERVNMANPLSSFNHDELQSPGVVFMVRQAKYDANYILCSLGFAQRLLDERGRVSAVELKLRKGASRDDVERILGSDFTVRDRWEQQEDVFRIMQVEKLMAYLFLCFILLVACLNIAGSMSMLMIDKKRDVETLRSMGATEGMVQKIFALEGRFISMGGAVIGVVLGLTLCLAQQELGIIRMGDSEGSFIVDAYPVCVQWTDVALVLLTVVAIGWLSTWLPARYLGKRLM